MTSTAFHLVPLPDLTVIDIVGADAPTFLHGQLTHDVTGLQSGQARLAGYCTAKGRLLGTMVFWRDTNSTEPLIRALVKNDIADIIIKRLGMFVLRAKVTLRHSPAKVGAAMKEAGARPLADPLQEEAAALPDLDSPWQVVQTATATWISAPGTIGGATRWWVVADEAAAPPQSSQNEDAAWQAADAAAGLPWVQLATQDLFIPQTLNLDLIDGVSFTKGCYPGQEVVARSHYRGTVKRRTAYGIIKQASGINANELAGTDTYDARRPANPCGRIVNAALSADGRLHVLMEVQLADLGQADFRLGSPAGPAIGVQPLPYEITAAS